ncbi:hypothetical protein MUK42_10309 [Musa troglodytarum]|uniref:Transmembrane protein n=1 Tax=Musa troglodytarum TaxID=320322 RepID=A0A9E7E8F3_9LILI|nr:hypothetical protein MUK42_10309 [Musa troglodytarum]
MNPASEFCPSPQQHQTAGTSATEIQPRSIVDGIFQNSWEAQERGYETSRHESKLKQILQFAFVDIIISLMAASAVFIAQRDLKDHANELHLLICGFLTTCSFLCGVTLMFRTINLLSRKNQSVQRGQHVTTVFLLVISCALLILTASGFSTLLHKRSMFLAALLPGCLILGTLLCFICHTGDDHDQNSTGYGSYKSELKHSLGLSSTVVSLAFSGLITTLIGTAKSHSEQALTINTKICIFQMFFAAMFGLLLMLLSSVPPSFKQQSTREFLTKVLKALNYSLLGSLALIAATAASAFLDVVLVLVLLPTPFLGVTLWFCIEWHSTQKQRHRPRTAANAGHDLKLKLVSKVATTTTSISFGGLMGVFSGFIGTKGSDLQLKLCVLVMFFAFLSSFSVNLLTFSTPKPGTLMAVIKILSTCSVLLLLFSAIVVFFLEFLGG